MADQSFFVQWTSAPGTESVTSVRLTDGDAAKPIVVMLHGTGGTIGDFSNPATSRPFNFDFRASFPPDRDEGWHWYPGLTAWSFELDPFKAVQGWEPFLRAAGFRTANYTQVDATGVLARPAVELAAVARELIRRFPDARLAFLAHSRGGVLVRKFLKDFATDAAFAGHIWKVITLATPHQGTEVANHTLTLRSLISALRVAYGPIIDLAFAPFVAVLNQPANQEFAVGSAFLTNLAQDEHAFAGATYHTFAGTSPLLTRVLAWNFTVGSAFPQWHAPPFHWTISLGETLVSPVLNSLPNLFAEITEGEGDTIAANVRAHLPFSATRTANPINHWEHLWDPALQSQVRALLDEVPPPGPRRVRCINKAHRQSGDTHIQAVGGMNAAGGRWRLSQPDVISRIEHGESFYVEEPAGDRVAIVVALSPAGHKYIKTVADGDVPNNLLALPECP